MTDNCRYFKEILDNLYDGVFFTDCERRVLYWNRGAEELTGYSEKEMVGGHCWDNIMIHIETGREEMSRDKCPLLATIQQGDTWEHEAFFLHKDGHRVPVLIRALPARDENGHINGASVVFRDNSMKIGLEERIVQLQRMAMLDPLTQLPNRRYLEIALNSRLNELKRYGWPFGIVFVDIDYFSKINHDFSFDTGDRVLQAVALTLRNSTRPFDTVGRFGGEEFMIILANIDQENLYKAAERFRTLISNSGVTEEEQRICVTVSIGATLARQSDSINQLLIRTDKHLFWSKRRGRNCVTSDGDIPT